MILNVISEKGGSIMENKWGTGDKRGTKLEFTVKRLRWIAMDRLISMDQSNAMDRIDCDE